MHITETGYGYNMDVDPQKRNVSSINDRFSEVNENFPNLFTIKLLT